MEQKDDSRLKEFRQLKREIRGSMEYLVVGIDISKDRHHAFFGMPTGKTLLRRLVFDNTRGGFESLCLHADTLAKQCDLKKVVFGMEPTADYHKACVVHEIIKCSFQTVCSGLFLSLLPHRGPLRCSPQAELVWRWGCLDESGVGLPKDEAVF